MRLKKKKTPLKEFLSECSEIHALMHGIWTGAKGIKWTTLPREARKEIKTEWQYFEAGQLLGWALKIVLAGVALKLGMHVV